MFFFFLIQVKNNLNKTALLIALGLLFSDFGDYFLMFEGEEFFLKGLGSFAVAHIFYIISFARDVLNGNNKSAILYRIVALILYFLAYRLVNFLEPTVP
jgi:uncharacterized membrane protein YhhN